MLDRRRYVVFWVSVALVLGISSRHAAAQPVTDEDEAPAPAAQPSAPQGGEHRSAEGEPSAPPSSDAAAESSEANHEAPRQAIELFQRARDRYRHGRYREAASDLRAALDLDPESPTLLYNLARVLELDGELEEAMLVYQRYRNSLPAQEQGERERTDLTIERLRGAQRYERPDEEAYLQPLYVQQRGVDDEAFWTFIVGGTLLGLAGAALAVAAVWFNDRADGFVVGRDGSLDERSVRYDEAQRLSLSADIVGGTSALSFLTAAILWVVRERTVEMYPSSDPAASEETSGQPIGTDEARITLGLRGAGVGLGVNW